MLRKNRRLSANLYIKTGSIWLISVLLILWIGNFTNLDVWLADQFYDFSKKTFPWKKAWLTAVFFHEWVKFVLVGLGLLLIGWAIYDIYCPSASALLRNKLRVVALSAVIIPTVISLLKRFSYSHCPWDIDRYGGYMPYIRLLDSVPPGLSPGQCMPAGHASSALWLASLAVFWLPKKPKLALTTYLGGLSAGFILGWFQQMRGAHFLTHTLWSAWIAGTIVLLLIFSYAHNLLRNS